MNLKFLLLAAVFTVSNFYAQEARNVIFLDSLGHQTYTDNYASYRLLDTNPSVPNRYQIKEYYPSGSLMAEGVSFDRLGMDENGIWTYYYESGNTKKTVTYSGSAMLGNFISYYDNGNKQTEGEFIRSTDKLIKQGPLKIRNFWNAENIQTVTNGDGDYQENEKDYTASGKVKNGFKDGLWIGTNNKYKFTFAENYKDGTLVSGVSTDAQNIQYQYSELYVMPSYKSGLEGFYKHIAKNFKTPEVAGLAGKIYCTFMVHSDGKISEVKIIRDIGYGTGQEATRVLNASPNWNPGTVRGVPTKMMFSLPIAIQSAR